MWKEKNTQEMLREDVLIGCVCKPRDVPPRDVPTVGQGREEEEPGGPRRPGCRGGRWARRVQSQEEEFRRQQCSAVWLQQRSRRMSFRKFCWVWQGGGA